MLCKTLLLLPCMCTVSNIVHGYWCICCVMQVKRKYVQQRGGRGGVSSRRGRGLGIGSRGTCGLLRCHPVKIHAGYMLNC